MNQTRAETLKTPNPLPFKIYKYNGRKGTNGERGGERRRERRDGNESSGNEGKKTRDNRGRGGMRKGYGKDTEGIGE